MPKPPDIKKLQSENSNNSLNSPSISQEEAKPLVSASLGSGWAKLYPESLDVPANITLPQMKPSLTPDAMNN